MKKKNAMDGKSITDQERALISFFFCLRCQAPHDNPLRWSARTNSKDKGKKLFMLKMKILMMLRGGEREGNGEKLLMKFFHHFFIAQRCRHLIFFVVVKSF